MWIDNGVNDIGPITEKTKDNKMIENHLKKVKSVLDMCQFFYEVLFDIDKISETAIKADDILIERDIEIAKIEREMRNTLDALNKEISYKLSNATNKVKGKVERLSQKLIDTFNHKIQTIKKEYDDRYNNPFIVRRIENCDRVDAWNTMAGFKVVSLSDRNFNLVDKLTWEEIFQGRFKQVELTNKKAIDALVVSSFGTAIFAEALEGVKDEVFDKRNKRRDDQIASMDEKKRAVVFDVIEHGPYMDSKVLDSIYKVMSTCSEGRIPDNKTLNVARRYLVNYDPTKNSFKYSDAKGENFVFTFLPSPTGKGGVLEVDMSKEYESEGIKRFLVYNPFGLPNKYLSTAPLSEYVVTKQPKCYTRFGELLKVKDGAPNKFLYQYVKLLRNNFAHALYNFYKNPHTREIICTGNEGAELHYDFDWFQNLQTSFSTIDQVLYGKNSANRGSLQYYKTDIDESNMVANNVFTIGIFPPLTSHLKSLQDASNYLKKGAFFTIEINDDIPHGEIQDFISQMSEKLSAKYGRYLNEAKTQIDREAMKIANDPKILTVDKYERKLAIEKEIYNKLVVQKILTSVENEIKNAKLSKKLNNFVVKQIKKVTDNKNVYSSCSRIANMLDMSGCFDTDENGQFRFTIDEQLERIQSALEFGSQSNIVVEADNYSNIVDYNKIGWLMDAIASSADHPDCDRSKGGNQNNFCIDLNSIKDMSIHKDGVLSSLGAFAMYCAICATGYAEVVIGHETKTFGIPEEDINNIKNLDMKGIRLKVGKVDGPMKQILINNDIEKRKNVLSILRHAVAHGNVKAITNNDNLRQPKDLVFAFESVTQNGFKNVVEMEMSTLMRFVKNPTFTKPTKFMPKTVDKVVCENQNKYNFEIVNTHQQHNKSTGEGR